jgi:hypothetical protein
VKRTFTFELSNMLGTHSRRRLESRRKSKNAAVLGGAADSGSGLAAG